MAGLTIHRKREFNFVRWVIPAAIVAILVATGAFYTYDWYVNGNKPPIPIFPASAYADGSVDEKPVTLGDINAYTVQKAHPRYIAIDALGIKKARVQTVKLSNLNTLMMPASLDDAGWYDESSLPGMGYGQVVIDGHSQGVGRKGIFAGIGTLSSGDKIVIERGDGKVFTYDVTRTTTLPLQAANTTGMRELLKSDDKAKEGLGLITDAGKWIPRDKVFDQRILVWAVAETSTDTK